MRQPIRVVRVFSRLNIGGPAIHVILLTAGLRSRGYETELIVGNETEREGNMLDLAAAKGVECTRLPGLQREIAPLDDFRAFLGLARIIRRSRPLVVHSHTAKAGVLARAAARLMRVPLVVHTFHGHVLKGYFGPRKTAFFKWLERTLGRRSDALLAVAPSVAGDLSELGVAPSSRMQVLPLGLELAKLAETLPAGQLRSEAAFPADARIVGLVGRLVPIKSVLYREILSRKGIAVDRSRKGIAVDRQHQGV